MAGGGEGVGVAGVGGAQGRAHLVVGLHRLDGQARHADGEFADGLGTRGDKGVFGDEQGMRPSFMVGEPLLAFQLEGCNRRRAERMSRFQRMKSAGNEDVGDEQHWLA